LTAPYLRLELALKDPLSTTKVKIEDAVAMPEFAKSAFYSSQSGKPNYASLYSVGDQPARRLADAVGFVIAGANAVEGPTNWCCSGALISKNLFLTNWHCGALPRTSKSGYWHQSICDATLIDLSWDTDENSRESLDYAILRIAPSIGAGAAAGQARPALIEPTGVKANENLRLVHHAECEKKRLSWNCRVVRDSPHGMEERQHDGVYARL
jgi:hypothetical protein